MRGYLLISRRYWSSDPSSNEGPRLPEPTCIGRMRPDLVLDSGRERSTGNLTLRLREAQWMLAVQRPDPRARGHASPAIERPDHVPALLHRPWTFEPRQP